MSADRGGTRARPARVLRLAGRAAVAAVLLGFLALLAYGVLTREPSRRIDESLGRAQAVRPPPFELPVLQRGDQGPRLQPAIARALADGRIASRELRGTPVVLNFWASWCPPCRSEASLLERAWRTQRAHRVVFVGLDMQDLTDDARAYLREFDVSYLNVRDESNRTARSWGVTGLPETFFLEPGGRVVGHVVGALSPRDLSEGIAAARSGRPIGPLEGGDRRPTR
jgi:cytochrome c biogenesis protein CcmG, thiol:disulfide interchange protein DsbE